MLYNIYIWQYNISAEVRGDSPESGASNDRRVHVENGVFIAFMTKSSQPLDIRPLLLLLLLLFVLCIVLIRFFTDPEMDGLKWPFHVFEPISFADNSAEHASSLSAGLQ